MSVVWRAAVNDLDVVARKQVAMVDCCKLKTRLFHGLAPARFRSRAHSDQPRPRRQRVIHERQRGVREGVNLPNKSVSYNAYAEFHHAFIFAGPGVSPCPAMRSKCPTRQFV